MAFKVSYIDKSGKPDSRTFGTLANAQFYSRIVKRATIAEVDVSAPIVEVVKVADGTVEAQRAATKAYYAPTAPRATLSAEQRAERKSEFFAESRAAGMSMEDAFSDWDWENGY